MPGAVVGLLILSASASSVAHSVHETGPVGNCTALADQWCNSPAAGCTATGALVAADAPAGKAGRPSWRCYNPGCLEIIKHGGDCKDFCTRPQLATIVTTCRLPPPPPPPPPQAQKGKDFVSEVFVPGELGYVCIRIPSIALAGDNKTLLAFAECRTSAGDGCEPLHPNATAHSKNPRDICQKSSTDSGQTWSSLKVIANNGAQGSPVWDAERKRMVLQYAELPCGKAACADTKQMFSTDNGKSWTEPESICGNAPGKLPRSTACGGAVGPGVGIQLKVAGPMQGRLLWIGHYGAYGHDTVWYSDDGGATHHVATGNRLEHMDEAQLVELPNGDVMANMRSSHYNRSCDCRAVARSTDGGSSFGPIEWAADLTSPVCAGTVLRGPGGTTYFANPSSKTARMDGVIRRSSDGSTWTGQGTAHKTVFAGAYAYSCLTNVPSGDRVGLLWETDGPQCKAGAGQSCRTVFSTFDASL